MAGDGFDLQAVEGPFTEQTWDFTVPEFRWLLDYWVAKRGARPCPRWRDIDLPALYKFAPNIVVKDAVEGGRDFRVRFWGTEITEWLRFDATGRFLSEYFPAAGREGILTAHRMALTGDMPVRRWGVSVYPERNYVAFECIDLPLEDDAGGRAHLLSMCLYRMIAPKAPDTAG
ncbi:MAG: hypothetical protein COW30_09750 [Rhodospirillales bacterium CG15_BIG_FIL_POST_REV_8_21_14_020_66_15]|nr:MAG: hypothetical protein COW30_09750 [Rhodospirillales bacterium CG15_BIG_FIL_POST_REV_8_21_14_020_66_15]